MSRSRKPELIPCDEFIVQVGAAGINSGGYTPVLAECQALQAAREGVVLPEAHCGTSKRTNIPKQDFSLATIIARSLTIYGCCMNACLPKLASAFFGDVIASQTNRGGYSIQSPAVKANQVLGPRRLR